MRRLALIALVLLASSTGLAQATFSRFDLDGQEQHRLNAADCSGEDMALFLEASVQLNQYQLRFVEYPRTGPLGGCPTDRVEPLATEIFPDETIVPTGGVILLQRNLARADLMGDASCTGAGRREAVYICAQLFALPGDLQALTTASLTFDIDTTLPPTATVTGVDGGNGKVTVGVAADDDGAPDSYTFRVEHRLCPDEENPLADGVEADPKSSCGAAADFETTEGAAPIVDIAVENGRTVELRVVTLDDFDNEAEPTDWVQATTVADLSPLALYDGAPNALSCDTSSCEDTDAAALVGALALLRLRRRRRSVVRRGVGVSGVLAFVLALGTASVASAQSHPDDPERRRLWSGLGRSTLSMALGAYRPNLDAGTDFPVWDCFFDDATLPQVSGGGDLHLWDGFGTLQLSVAMDIAQANGFAQPLEAGELGTCQEPTKTATQLTLLSVRPGLTYRFDPLLDWVGFPLVPYGRVGLVGMGYMWSRDGELGVDNGHNPIGARYGWEGALGLMLALDFLDWIDPFTPQSTRRARANGVFDHTFIFVEGAFSDVTSFGQPGFDLSPRDAFLGTGLPATFRAGLAVELL